MKKNWSSAFRLGQIYVLFKRQCPLCRAVLLTSSTHTYTLHVYLFHFRVLRGTSHYLQCPLRPSEIENMWHMMKNQNSPFFAQRYCMVALETWWH